MSKFIMKSDKALANFRHSGRGIYQGLGGYTRPRMGVGRRMGAFGSNIPVGINYGIGVWGKGPARRRRGWR